MKLAASKVDFLCGEVVGATVVVSVEHNQMSGIQNLNTKMMKFILIFMMLTTVFLVYYTNAT